MDEIKMKVVCKELNGGVSTAEVTMDENNDVSATTSEQGPTIPSEDIDSGSASQGEVLTADGTGGTTWEQGITEDQIPGLQATTTVVADALTNLNGRRLTSYEATLTEDMYTFYTITKGNQILTEEQARDYMEYMTGSRFLPSYDYEKPQNSLFLFADNSMWKPQFDSTNGLRLYKLGETGGSHIYYHTFNVGTEDFGCLSVESESFDNESIEDIIMSPLCFNVRYLSGNNELVVGFDTDTVLMVSSALTGLTLDSVTISNDSVTPY